jgi:hypothetical protein
MMLRFYLFWMLIFLSWSLFAQRFDGGFKAGLVASEVSGDGLAGPNKLGWYAGVFTSRGISQFASLQLELAYITKGSRGVPSEKQPRDYRFNLSYAETAMFFKHDLKPFSSQAYIQKMSAELGLSLGVLVNYYEEENDLELDFSVERPFYNYEGNIWAGLYFPVSEKIKINFRFSNSITPIRKHQSGQVIWYNWGQYHTLWTFGAEFTL